MTIRTKLLLMGAVMAILVGVIGTRNPRHGSAEYDTEIYTLNDFV